MSNHRNINDVFQEALTNKLSLKTILSDALKPHTRNDVVRKIFYRASTDQKRIDEWQKPWLFVWVFGYLLFFSIVFGFCMNSLSSFVPFFQIISSSVIPFTFLTFIWEMDIHRNVPFSELILLVILGGVLSIFFALGVNTRLIHGQQAYLAGFTEEPSKLVVCLIFMTITGKRFNCLDGLAIGAAVAAGFSFIETVQYSFRYGLDVILARNIDQLITGGHVLFTAPFVGALCYRMNDHPFRLHFLSDSRFLKTFAICMLCHAAHNLNFPIFSFFDGLIDAKGILLGIFEWFLLIRMFSLGIRQALQKKEYALDKSTPIQVFLNGRRIDFPVNQVLSVGRSPNCDIVLPSTDVSRIHCRIAVTREYIVVMDMGSRNGTYINGKQIEKNKQIRLNRRDTLKLGKSSLFEFR